MGSKNGPTPLCRMTGNIQDFRLKIISSSLISLFLPISPRRIVIHYYLTHSFPSRSRETRLSPFSLDLEIPLVLYFAWSVCCKDVDFLVFTHYNLTFGNPVKLYLVASLLPNLFWEVVGVQEKLCRLLWSPLLMPNLEVMWRGGSLRKPCALCLGGCNIFRAATFLGTSTILRCWCSSMGWEGHERECQYLGRFDHRVGHQTGLGDTVTTNCIELCGIWERGEVTSYSWLGLVCARGQTLYTRPILIRAWLEANTF